MKHIKLFENFDFKTPLIELVELLNNIIDYRYIDDDVLEIEVKSGNDKSNNCPDSIRFLIKFTGDVDVFDEFHRPSSEHSFNIKCLFNNEEVGNYLLSDAKSAIQYYYRLID